MGEKGGREGSTIGQCQQVPQVWAVPIMCLCIRHDAAYGTATLFSVDSDGVCVGGIVAIGPLRFFKRACCQQTPAAHHPGPETTSHGQDLAQARHSRQHQWQSWMWCTSRSALPLGDNTLVWGPRTRQRLRWQSPPRKSQTDSSAPSGLSNRSSGSGPTRR